MNSYLTTDPSGSIQSLQMKVKFVLRVIPSKGLTEQTPFLGNLFIEKNKADIA